MRSIFIFYFILIYNLLIVCSQANLIKELPIIPKPKLVQIVGGNFEASKIKTLLIPAKEPEALRIGKSIQLLLNLPELEIKKIKGAMVPSSKSLTLSLTSNPEKPEYYKINITKNGIWIQASKPIGWFYALQSLTQMVELSGNYNEKNKLLPYCLIEDEPAFAYRGLHLDVGRHFFPVSFIKKYLELMARFKYNYFHWHLTEDQGWRIEIKQFPKLTEIGSIRKSTIIGSASDYPKKFDSTEYKGFYTQEEIKEVIRFASELHIEIIPEIEMPGHSTAAIAAYPEFSCSGKSVEVANQWGVFDSGVYCTKDTSLWFVKEILTEICELFPGKYIHIGGDECPKTNWKNCDQCQAVKRRNNLKTEEDLQSYFIRQIEKFLNSKNKQLIGWDEILEGGLAPNATVMSWRGTEGGIAAAKQKHPVIMCPGTHCYFDHYQSLQVNEPLAIGGYTSLKKTYSFNPIPSELKPAESVYIIGAQGNLWTEYMADEKQVLYMAYPRAIALSEVNWSDNNTKNYTSFLNRLQYHIPWFATKNMSITQGMMDIEYNTNFSNEGVVFIFQKPAVEGKILIESKKDGDDVSEYLKQDSFILTKDINFKAWYQLENKSLGKPLTIQYKHHLAVAKSIVLKEQVAKKYFQGGANCLINGIEAPSQKYGGPEWVGLEGTDLNVTLDLGKVDSLKLMKIQFFHNPGTWIYRPKDLEIRTSVDGINYSEPIKYQINETESKYLQPTIPLNNVGGRYIQLSIHNHGIIEEKMPGAGRKAWLFVGEIELR
ncbi:MAG: family 20 glycosylhydrolase [Saprospiraceae bacterium]